jgi:hypothetical protein
MTRNRSSRPVFSQSHAGAAAIGVEEFDAGFFKGAADRKVIPWMACGANDKNGFVLQK